MQWEGNYESNLGPWLREPAVSEGFWAYIDVYDLADAIRLAAEASTPGHEVVYIASPDIASHEPLEELARRFHGDAAPEIRPSDEARPSGISIAKARRLLGYDPQRSWRDYLDDEGRLRPSRASGSSAARPASSAGAGSAAADHSPAGWRVT